MCHLGLLYFLPLLITYIPFPLVLEPLDLQGHGGIREPQVPPVFRVPLEHKGILVLLVQQALLGLLVQELPVPLVQ